MIIFAILPVRGLANAAATLVGQNLGAKKPERAAQAAWTTSFYTMIFLFGVSAVCIVLAPGLISFFRDDPEVVRAGIESQRIICAGYVFFAYGMVLSQSLNGAGDTFTLTLINLLCFWFLQVPLAALFALYFEWGASGVYWAVFATEVIFALACILVFRRGKWKQVVI